MSDTDLERDLDQLAADGIFLCPHCDQLHNVDACDGWCDCCDAIAHQQGWT